jgi:hypothetical protein
MSNVMNDYDYDLDDFEVAQASLDDWREFPFRDEEEGLIWIPSEESPIRWNY